MTVLETERLLVRRFSADDAGFVLALLNDAAFLRFIGDRGVRTLDDARSYIETGALASYAQHGYGPYLVALRSGSLPIGQCGFRKRDWLEDPDLGFAFLPDFRSQGFAFESARAVMDYARSDLGLQRIAAIMVPGNEASMRLLKRLGFAFQRRVRTPEQEELELHGSEP